MAVRVSGKGWGSGGQSRSKFGNKRTVRDGVTFDSKAEADRWSVLCILAKTGHLENLERQVSFRIEVNGEKICDYIADFRYLDTRTGQIVVEDVKSEATKTPAYNLKKKLMKAVHRVEISEVM